MVFRTFASPRTRRVVALAACTAVMLFFAGLDLSAAEPLPGVTNSIGMKLVAIPAGDFMMGSSAEDIRRLSQFDEEVGKKKSEAASQQEALLEKFEGKLELTESQGPQHRVTISKSYYLGAHEVTQQDFLTVMGYNPSAHASTGVLKDRLVGRDTKRHPVDSVLWEDAAEFCRQLSSLPAEIAAGRTYRLPTEAEWEYACRAGTTTSFYWGERAAAKVREQREYGPLTETSGKVTWPVGLKEANPWGLYDMTGNVTEWCADWFDAKAYQRKTFVDPQGPTSGDERVLRGAAVSWQAHRMRSAARYKFPPETFHKFRGFRVACDARESPRSAPSTPSISQLDTQLRQKGLTRQGTFYALAEEAEFTRFVTALERMRAVCFTAQRECREIENQLAQNKMAKADALKTRIAARTYINYSDTWREHWNGVRARHNATDMLVIAELTKDDLKKWQNDAQADFQSALARFVEQLRVLRDRYGKIQESNRKLVDDADVQRTLAAINAAGSVNCKLGPSPALLAAAKKLDTEEATLRQLTGK